MLDYLNSVWGFITNASILFVFGLISYDTYAKRWAAKTGRFFVEGVITFSEMMDTGQRGRAMQVSYSYYFNGTKHVGEVPGKVWGAEQFVLDHPKGKAVTVYYAPKDSWFSRINKPPSHIDIIGNTVFMWLLFPMVGINMVSGYLYWLKYLA